MTFKRFEQLPVWQAAIKLGQQIYTLTATPAFRRQRSLRDQIEGAAVSNSNNIAEGFERGTTQELLTFLYIARGSAGEVRSMLCLLEGMDHLVRPEFANLKSEISNLKSQAESISRQLRAWADSPQNTPIKGQRYLNENARKSDRAARDREDFVKELEEIRTAGSPSR
jgi:four helix bundle protein